MWKVDHGERAGAEASMRRLEVGLQLGLEEEEYI